MTTPEEAARQIVPSLLRPGLVRISDTAGDAWVTLRDEDDISALRLLFQRVIEKATREGAKEATAEVGNAEPDYTCDNDECANKDVSYRAGACPLCMCALVVAEEE